MYSVRVSQDCIKQSESVLKILYTKTNLDQDGQDKGTYQSCWYLDANSQKN